MEYLVISGMSGAGKSLTVDVLEDMGYYCIDNMPVFLIPNFLELFSAAHTEYSRVAFVIDSRGGKQDFQPLFKSLTELRERGDQVKILFLTASDEVLINRQKAARRRHPLDNGCGVAAAIEKERELLSILAVNADCTINTASLSAAGLKSHVEKLFSEPEESIMAISINTFGFKHGAPRDADLLFDVRFLPNPYYNPEMRDRTGCDADVAEYVFSTPESQQFMTKLIDMVSFLIPQYIKEGKRNLVISVGCTGGRHRSVAVGERLSAALNEQGHSTAIYHRDSMRK
jgi:UPF0042 nucleotide-binding protein